MNSFDIIRGATIFILGDLDWDQLQLIISKSTTADLLKMHHKLDEFFSQQFKSSKRVFSSLQPTRHKSSVKQKPKDANRKLTNGGHDFIGSFEYDNYIAVQRLIQELSVHS